jgi:hypothetical protein
MSDIREIAFGDNFDRGDRNRQSSERQIFEIDFERISIERNRSLRFPRPTHIQDFVETLDRQHLLILAGSPGINKNDLALSIARDLNHYIAQNSHGQHKPLETLQWTQRCDPQTLIARVREVSNTSRSIFLLPQPRNLTWEHLNQLKDHATPYHYIVVSTENSISDWQIPSEAQKIFWKDLLPQGLFNPDELAEALIERLLEKRNHLPPGILMDQLAPGNPICEKITLREIVQKLGTVNHILWFLGSLFALRQPVSDQTINELIKQSCRSDTLPPDEALLSWYRTLDQRRQLLALNVGMLEGMYDNQFFAALEQLFNHVWRDRNPQLRAYDYDDLAALEPFCSQMPTPLGGRLIQMQLPGNQQQIEQRWRSERQLLLQAAWSSQRRQILAALPLLAELVKNSVDARSLDLELYGSRVQRMRLREVIGETISEIGMLDQDAVQTTLITLAADNNTTIQLAAAKAMARWRHFDQHAMLFQTLDRWHTEARVIELFEALLGDKDAQQRESGQAYVEATIALTVSAAAQYDPPNQLAPELVKLFRQLSQNTKRFVRTRFCAYTLPRLVRRHLAQLRPELRSMTRYVDLDWAIAESLAQTFAHEPQEVLRTLAQWYNECEQNRPSVIDPRKLTLRETMMATIALTYGEIDYSAPHSQLTFSEAFERLMMIMGAEVHPQVRTAVVLAVGSLAERHFEQVEPHLRRLVRELPEHERQDIIKILVGIYTQQRASLQGSSDRVTVDNQRYPVWHSSPRPLTSIEQSIKNWIGDVQNPVAQQMGLWAMTEFEGRINRPIEQAAEQQREEQRRAAMNPAPTLTTASLVSAPRSASWYLRTLVPLLVTFPTGGRYRATIRHLLPEALERRRIDQAALHMTLVRLEYSSDQTLHAITPRLRRAMKLADQGCLMFGILLVGLLVLLCIGAQIATALLRGALR